jgi:sugar lactone lactonase YvrE
LAGAPTVSGSADGTGSAARFYYPYAVAVDASGHVYVGDTYNFTVRKITPAGVVTTLPGTPGVSGSADGTGSTARFNGPDGIAVDSLNNVYVGDYNNQVIRKITPTGVVTTLAGVAGSYGIADGMGTAARFIKPAGIAIASSGTLYVADSYNHEIRNGVPADLKITCTDGKTIVSNGTSDTYTGLQNLNGAVITDTFPTQVQSVTYAATGNGGDRVLSRHRQH